MQSNASDNGGASGADRAHKDGSGSASADLRVRADVPLHSRAGRTLREARRHDFYTYFGLEEVGRRRAWELYQQGWAQTTIAEALGVTRGAVSQWLAAARDQGVDALRSRSRRGQGARLAEADLARVPALLARGAEAFGFVGEVWTCGRIAAVLERELGVAYHPGHVRRLVHRLGWTYQTPVLVASQRDDEAVAAWTAETWPALKIDAWQRHAFSCRSGALTLRCSMKLYPR